MSTTISTITVHLSKKAQRDALLAGLPAQEEQVYPVTAHDDLVALLALRGSDVRSDGTAHHNGHVWRADGGYSYLSLETLPASATEAIAAVAAASAAYAAQEKADAEERKAREDREYADRAELAREAKRLADMASLDAALRRVLTTEEAAAVYAGEHANVPLGVLSADAARERLKDALLPLPVRERLKTPVDDYGETIAGSFEVDEGEDAELSIDEAKRAMAVRAEVDRALRASDAMMEPLHFLLEEYSAELRVHRFEADDDDDLGGVPAPRNVVLYVRMVLRGGAVLVKELAV